MIITKVKSSQGCLKANLGCEEAPDQVIEELDNTWSREDGINKIFTVNEVKIVKGNLEETNKNIENASGDIFIGGDHSITYSLAKGLAKKGEIGIISFDAHPDCYKTENFSIPTHEDWLASLIKDNIVKKENVILVGCRNFDPKELEFIKENNIKYFNMSKIEDNIENACNNIMEIAINFKTLYLSLDIDVVDPAFAPGTGYLEVGGLSSRDLIYFIQRIRLLKNLKRVDIVEINPKKDLNNMTVKLGAKLVKELIR
ncbi:MAG: arginase family protein [Candidatus Nanoarchaeia archaeon]|nr:arginase family protein [Candidatus Nanoarchaeia archaeon]